MTTIFHNGRILNGDTFSHNHYVEVEQDRISRITTEKPVTGTLVDLEGGYLVPAFIDLQIYGGNGSLFGEHPSVDTLKATRDYSVAGGATQILPTVATNSNEIMQAAIEAVREYWRHGLPGVIGLHLEGPYINPKRRGAHIAEYIRSPSMHEVQRLMETGRGVIRLMTIAPEMCSLDVLEYLQHSGVTISAGHTDANFAQASSAFGNGIDLATHLFNAMSPLQHRAPGMVGAVLHSPEVNASIIADGHHVDYSVITLAKKVMQERLFLITDAVAENAEGVYQHRMQGDKYTMPDGTLSGSALTMLKAVRNCISYCGIPMEEALRMASLYPAKVIGMDDVCGRIAEGYQAELLWLDDELQLKAVFTGGSLLRSGL